MWFIQPAMHIQKLQVYLLYRVFENCKDLEEINTYIIDMGISDRNKKRLEELAEHYSRKLIFLNS